MAPTKQTISKMLQWRNWLARSTVNRKDGGSSPPWSDPFVCMAIVVSIETPHLRLADMCLSMQVVLRLTVVSWPSPALLPLKKKWQKQCVCVCVVFGLCELAKHHRHDTSVNKCQQEPKRAKKFGPRRGRTVDLGVISTTL